MQQAGVQSFPSFYYSDRLHCVPVLFFIMQRPEKKPELCLPGSNASLACGETCDVCDAPRPTQAPVRAPTTPPIVPGYVCDDDKYQQFQVSSDENQTCIWLAARPENQTEFCQANHPSGAFDICEETCAKCADDCDDTSGTFDFIQGNETSKRDCLWLSLRTTMQEELCVVGNEVMSICPETCDTCDGDGTLAPSATPPPAPLSRYCDDSMEETFFVAALDQFQRCVWLAAREDYQAELCVEGHSSNARSVCPETCGVCTDDCDDTDEKYLVGTANRDCLWLTLRPNLHEELCAREDVQEACPETCNVCDAVM